MMSAYSPAPSKEIIVPASSTIEYRPHAYPQVEAAVLDSLRKGAEPIVLDLDSVVALDTQALRGLIKLLRQARSAGGDIALRSSRADVLRTLSVTALDRVFAVERQLAA